ncbi:MAG: DoxX family protein [Thermodesulfovibrionales bacterium]
MNLLLRTDNNLSSLFLRLSLGIVVFPHGAQKVLGWYGGPGFYKTIEFFGTQLHFPVWLILLLMITEFLGSIGLVFGFLTRICALAIGTSMAVCAYLNHLKNGFFMNWFGTQQGEGFEYHILVVGISLALLIKGGGFLSIDRAMSGKK